MKKTTLIIILIFLSFRSLATETKIIVRAKAKDAKFIGSSIGGAYVIIRNKVNNKILAEGKTKGNTGNSSLIMKTPKKRNGLLSDENTAKFLAIIDIDEPVFISIEVISPLNNKQAQIKVSTELWLIPGKDILGDGIILEIPGFIVDVLKPTTHQYISLNAAKEKPFLIRANVVMMCGCTITKGGMWDSEQIEVKGILKKNDVFVKEFKMALIENNLFEGRITLKTIGKYELVVYAYNSKSGNTGVDKVNYLVYD